MSKRERNQEKFKQWKFAEKVVYYNNRSGTCAMCGYSINVGHMFFDPSSRNEAREVALGGTCATYATGMSAVQMRQQASEREQREEERRQREERERDRSAHVEKELYTCECRFCVQYRERYHIRPAVNRFTQMPFAVGDIEMALYTRDTIIPAQN